MLETIEAMRRPSRAMLRPRICHPETSAMLRASRREEGEASNRFQREDVNGFFCCCDYRAFTESKVSKYRSSQFK